MDKRVADTIAKAVLQVAETYETRTGKPAMKFIIELSGDLSDPEPLPAKNDISINLSTYSVDIELVETLSKPTSEGHW